MSIDFTPKKFGSNDSKAAPAADRPKAEYWLNIGYQSDVPDDNGDAMFVSLPQGIPLDTQEHLKTNSSNNKYAAFQSARNDLVDQLVAHAQASLAPGESTTVQLTVQIRRVKEEAAPINPENNPFAKQLSFA